MMWGILSSDAGLTDIREVWSHGHEVLSNCSVRISSFMQVLQQDKGT